MQSLQLKVSHRLLQCVYNAAMGQAHIMSSGATLFIHFLLHREHCHVDAHACCASFMLRCVPSFCAQRHPTAWRMAQRASCTTVQQHKASQSVPMDTATLPLWLRVVYLLPPPQRRPNSCLCDSAQRLVCALVRSACMRGTHTSGFAFGGKAGYCKLTQPVSKGLLDAVCSVWARFRETKAQQC